MGQYSHYAMVDCNRSFQRSNESQSTDQSIADFPMSKWLQSMSEMAMLLFRVLTAQNGVRCAADWSISSALWTGYCGIRRDTEVGTPRNQYRNFGRSSWLSGRETQILFYDDWLVDRLNDRRVPAAQVRSLFTIVVLILSGKGVAVQKPCNFLNVLIWQDHRYQCANYIIN